MVRFLGFVFFLLILAGVIFHIRGSQWVALTFFIGGAAIVVGIIVKVIKRYW